MPSSESDLAAEHRQLAASIRELLDEPWALLKESAFYVTRIGSCSK